MPVLETVAKKKKKKTPSPPASSHRGAEYYVDSGD
jgi:hypothetical protein